MYSSNFIFGYFAFFHLSLFPIFLPKLCLALSSSISRKSSQTTNSGQCQCASEETFVGGLGSGVFKSPAFPLRYCNNLNCRWNIEPLKDSFVGAMLDFFETEHRFDVLEVYQTSWNGTVLRSAKQAILHGQFDGRKMERQFFSSVGGGLLFSFISDNTDSDYHGFQITFRRYPKNDRSNAPCPPPFQLANSTIQTLPSLSPNFHMDSSCIFILNSTEAVNLTINQFRASSALTLKVYETEIFQVRTQLDRPMAKIEPGIAPSLPLSITSRTRSLTILLSTQQTPFSTHSDISLAGGYGQALYDIQFVTTQSLCACPSGELVVSRLHPSSLLSPGYPLEYCDSVNCTVNVSLEGPRSRIGNTVEGLRLKIEAFQTEPDMDYIGFWDANGEILLTLSHEAHNIGYLTFDRTQFAYSFVTDPSIVENGFNITVEAFKQPKECLCPASPRAILDGRFHHEENSYDPQKCAFMDCFWLINAPKSSADRKTLHRIVLKINHTFVAQDDFILIYQGVDRFRNPFAQKLNTISAGVETVIEFEGTLAIGMWFHREVSEREGSLAELVADPPLHFNFTYEWREVCLCGPGVFRAELNKWQSLHSPDFPNTYCRDMRCRWRLDAPKGHHILLNISAFDTEAHQDFLYIFEGNETGVAHKEMLTGMYYGNSIVHGTKDVMTLLFTSDGSLQAKGFEIWFRAEENPEDDESSTASSGFHKGAVFFLFLCLALIGGTFFAIKRSSNQNLFSQYFANTFAEERVRFTRGWNNHRRRQQASSGYEEDSSADHSFSNPLPQFRLP